MKAVDPCAREQACGRARTDRSQRVLTDEEGRLWRVRELQFDDAPPSLVFESETGFRRVRAYPATWHSLTDTELFDISWRT